MKKFFYFLFFLFFSSVTLYAQNYSYVPFPTKNAVWIDKEFEGGGFPNECITNHYQLNGDTLINGTNYHKLYGFREEWINSIGFHCSMGTHNRLI